MKLPSDSKPEKDWDEVAPKAVGRHWVVLLTYAHGVRMVAVNEWHRNQGGTERGTLRELTYDDVKKA